MRGLREALVICLTPDIVAKRTRYQPLLTYTLLFSWIVDVTVELFTFRFVYLVFLADGDALIR